VTKQDLLTELAQDLARLWRTSTCAVSNASSLLANPAHNDV